MWARPAVIDRAPTDIAYADLFQIETDEAADIERPVETDLDHAHALTPLQQPLHGLLRHLGAGTHQHQHPFGLRMADVFVGSVQPSGEGAELAHRLLDQIRHRGVEGIRRFAGLKEGVGVLRRAAQHRTIGRQRASPRSGDQLVGQHGSQHLVVEHFDLGHFVRSAEAIEEVQEGNPGAQSRDLGDQRLVLRLLDRAGGKQGEAGLTAGHDVRVVAEDRQRVGGDGARRDVDDGRGELAGDLEHVRDHQQQALRRGEGGGQSARLQRAIDGSTKRFHEKLAYDHQAEGTTANYMADSYVVVPVVASATVTGLSHLEGETVVVWAAGAAKMTGDDPTTYVVTGGEITLDAVVTGDVIVGLSYQGRWKSAKLAYGANTGTAMSLKKKINMVAPILYKTHTRGVKYGHSFSKLTHMPRKVRGVDATNNAVLADYDYDNFPIPDGGWDNDSRLCMLFRAPLPATVLGIGMLIEGHG